MDEPGAEANHSFTDIKHLKDLGKGFLAELEDFFVNYHQLSGKKYRVIDAKGPNEAAKRIENAMREFRKR